MEDHVGRSLISPRGREGQRELLLTLPGCDPDYGINPVRSFQCLVEMEKLCPTFYQVPRNCTVGRCSDILI